MLILIFVISLIALIAIGIPIAFSLLITGIILAFVLGAYDTQMIAQTVIGGANSFPLMAIPFFILTGELMNAGGMSKRIIHFAMTVVGHIRGGLGYVAVIASVLFAGLTGSAVAEIAAIGSILIPMMVKSGYNRNRSTGLIAAGGIIGPIIPPSIPLIIMGVTANISISQLFLAGVVPGILMALGLVIAWWLLMRKEKPEVFERKSFKDMIIAFGHTIWALILPVIILVGLRFGVFTPTEAGVVAVAYALIVGMVIYRELKIKHLFEIMVNTAKTSSIVIFLVACSMVTAKMLTLGKLPMQILDLLEPLVDSPVLLLLMINLLVLIIGMAMDLIPIVLILVPVTMPLITAAGIHPVVFGLMFIFNACIGLLTPPVGAAMNVACGVGRINMLQFVKGIWPFLLVYVILLLAMIFFPQIILSPLGWLTGK